MNMASTTIIKTVITTFNDNEESLFSITYALSHIFTCTSKYYTLGRVSNTINGNKN